jgi:hypothetical protein
MACGRNPEELGQAFIRLAAKPLYRTKFQCAHYNLFRPQGSPQPAVASLGQTFGTLQTLARGHETADALCAAHPRATNLGREFEQLTKVLFQCDSPFLQNGLRSTLICTSTSVNAMSSSVASIANDLTMFNATNPEPRNRVAPVEPLLGVADLDQFETWRDISELLAKRSVSMLRRKGFQGWAAAGGQTTPHGLMTFGDGSFVVRRTLARLDEGGIRYSDGQLNWAVRLTENSRGKPGFIRGIGLGADFDIRLFCKPRRWTTIRHVAAELREATQPTEGRDDDEWRQIDRLRLRHRQLALLDAGLAMLPLLVTTQTAALPSAKGLPARELATVAWGAAASAWPADWRTELVEAITILERIIVQTVILKKSGWCPRATSRRPAICSLRSRRGLLCIQIDRLFLRFLDCLANSGCPANEEVLNCPERAPCVVADAARQRGVSGAA